ASRTLRLPSCKRECQHESTSCQEAYERFSEVVVMEDGRISSAAHAPFTVVQNAAPANVVERYKASLGGDGLRILECLPQIMERGAESLTPAEKELLKWLGVFYRRPTPGKFMMRIRMPNGFARSEQLRAIAELSRRLGNGAVDITTRQQIELRGFSLDSVPEIWEKLRGVELRSLQTGLDNVRNINGCPLAGANPHELLDASPVVQDLDRIIVGEQGNPQFTNLPRKFNITVTGCPDNCTHAESQDIALVPAKKAGRVGHELAFQGRDMRSSSHGDRLGVTRQRQEGLRAVGLCVPTGRVNPEQLDELARLAAIYGNGEIRLTTAQNAIIPHIPADAVGGLLAEPLLRSEEHTSELQSRGHLV